MARSRWSDNPFERAHVWPIRLRIGGLAGVTLWGAPPDDRDTDVVLSLGGRVALFANLAEVRRAIAPHSPLDLRFGRCDARRLGVRASDDAWRRSARRDTFDLDVLLTAWRRPPVRWTMRTTSVVVNALNLAWDVAATVADERMVRVCVSRGRSGLGTLADLLTTYDPALDRDKLAALDPLRLQRRAAALHRDVCLAFSWIDATGHPLAALAASRAPRRSRRALPQRP